MKRLIFLFCLLSLPILATAQVKNTSYITPSGEKVLRVELTIPLDKKGAWQLFTKDAELKKWIAPQAHIELQTGGYILTNYDSTKTLADSSSIRLPIVNYLDQELLTLKVILNNHFPKQVQDEDDNLQEIIQFVPVASNQTKIISSMIGWGKGPAWDKTYDFFVKGNTWTYEELRKLFK